MRWGVSERLCAFLVASNYASNSGAGLGYGVSDVLLPACIDDPARGGPPNSFGDLVTTALSSPFVNSQIGLSVGVGSPYKPQSCDQNICVLGACTCSPRSSATSR
ncbi:MAG: hypothetical protein U1E65_05445 [Myxococcota bacterium]